MYTLKFARETCSYCLPKRPGVSLPHSHNHPQRLGAGTIPRLHDTRQRYPLGASPAQAVPLPGAAERRTQPAGFPQSGHRDRHRGEKRDEDPYSMMRSRG